MGFTNAQELVEFERKKAQTQERIRQMQADEERLL